MSLPPAPRKCMICTLVKMLTFIDGPLEIVELKHFQNMFVTLYKYMLINEEDELRQILILCCHNVICDITLI